MIELKQNKIWSDSLSSVLGLDQPWDNIEKPLQKFICFGEGGDSGGAGDGSGDPDVETDIEFGEPITGMTAEEAVAATSAAEAQAGLGAAADAAATVQAIQNPIQKDPTIPTMELMGLTYTPNKGFGFKGLAEFFTDLVEFVSPPVGLAIRGLASLTGKADDLGLNTQNPIAEVENLARGLGFQGLAETVAPVAQAVDTTTTAVQGLASDALGAVQGLASNALGAIGVDVSPTSTPTEAPVSTAASTPSSAITSSEVDDFDFEPASNSEISRGIASIVRNPLEVRPQQEVQPSSRFGNFTRRPFVFTPGRIFAQTGGGIQSLINQQPTLLDVVNTGMAIPEETIPSQRPQPFIKGQQPGGLRSTNYYTNAMQPASFYAQPQQVKNYGSIY
jgi:hypothetical protein